MMDEHKPQVRSFLKRVGDSAGTPPNFETACHRALTRTRRGARVRRFQTVGAVIAVTSLVATVMFVIVNKTPNEPNLVAGPATTRPATSSTENSEAIPSTSPDLPQQPTTSQPTTTSDLPAMFVAVGIDGVAYVRRVDDGSVVEELGQVGFPGHPQFLEDLEFLSVRSLSGSDSVLVGRCCEPVSGNVYLLSGTNTIEEATPIFVGYQAIPSGGGELVATSNFITITIRDAVDHSSQAMASIDMPSPGRQSMQWIPDRPILVWLNEAEDDGTLTLGTVEVAGSQIKTESDPNTIELSLIEVSLAVDHAGVVLVAGCAEVLETRCLRSELWTVDPWSGATMAVNPIEAGASLGGFDPSGHHLIYTDETGSAYVLSSDGGVTKLGNGYASVAW